MNLRLTLANATEAETDRRWKGHRNGCPPCSRAQRNRRPAEMCTGGRELYGDWKQATADLAEERKAAKRPIPGQGALWTETELEPFTLTGGML